MDDAGALIELAKQRFGSLGQAEQRFLKAVANGILADYDSPAGQKDTPGKSPQREESRAIRAGLASWLATDPSASRLVGHRGIWVRGAWFDGVFDLAGCRVPFPILLLDCAVLAGMSLQNSELPLLGLPGSTTGYIGADGMRVSGSLLLREGFTALDGVSIAGVRVDGQANFSGAILLGSQEHPRALNAESLTAKNGLLLRDLVAVGEISLVNARITGNMSFGGALVVNPLVRHDTMLFLRAEGALLSEEVLTRIRQLASNASSSSEEELAAIVADGVVVEGGAFFNRGFCAVGSVRLLDARLSGQLACMEGVFSNSAGSALAADWLRVGGTVFLSDEFAAYGEVRLLGAHIEGALNCIGGHFQNPQGDALCAEGVTVNGSVFLCGSFVALGNVSMVHADVRCGFACHGLTRASEMTLDLQHASFRTLADDEESWPPEGKLFLSGLEYRGIDDRAPRSVMARLSWLRRQPRKEFHHQPYEQLARVLRENGQDDDAKQILLAKNEDRLSRGPKLSSGARSSYRIFGALIGYGYRPLRAFRFIVVILALGWLFFGLGFRGGVMVPRTPTHGTPSALMYSLDLFVPVIDFDQAKHWSPDPNGGRALAICHTGDLLRLYLWFEIAAGWILTSLLVAALSGVIKK